MERNESAEHVKHVIWYREKILQYNEKEELS